ncbi:copper homeostasis membrane protein CopD [Pseudomonas chengduensis]|uniref:Copper resistance protein D n=1 Tax=Ectopseudomonas oleovorans TaxID=301 RepID=A0A379KC40_ECTOL|nr:MULTISPECIES: copper homeostasis membrane protein CopD [Pseudomonas]MDH0624135.1 copper homeostasis membrane protein CopD [Pseudomonas chengduensis]MDH1213441.1 copper homeostasis membrane protein CopD [Pseudomonas chengduensis]MDH1281731.1 copper homeostasis membrane protein CopD [Pseudomonas chengduensis]MDH1667440.1 copper homeostasis membrane protein CopD [Pseudomonas chengduensis]MDH1680580.1 copper homeostasis membrane protein CopD [Pseudomonas chengduensis]
MFSLLDYGLRLAQYLDLMLLFGLPLFAWYSPAALTVSGDRRSLLPKRALSLGLLICAVLGLALVSIEIARNAAGIMGVAVSDLARDDLAWYLFDIPAGRAGLTRALLLFVLISVLGWQLWRGERPFPVRRVTVLAGAALLSLAWNGHAAGGEGVSGAVRLVAGMAHLLAAGGWIGAIFALLILFVRHGKPAAGEGLHMLWRALHTFSRPGTVFVGVLVVTGILHYGDLVGWSIAPLFHSRHGNLMLLKLALFAAMLGLAALHRWWLVPRLERDIHTGVPSHSAQHLRLSVTIEATIALLILVSVAVLGTLSPHG